MTSVRRDVTTKLDGFRRDLASLRREMRWAVCAVVGVMLAGFSGFGAGLWLLYAQLVDMSAGTAVRIIEVGQPVIDGTVAP